MTVYQIAEATGTLRADDVRDTLTPTDLCEWAFYLNSPFSRRGREMLMNGWLVHIVRSIMADKKHRPKFSDSIFPFEKLAKEFFAAGKKGASVAVAIPKGVPTTPGEIAHVAQIHAKNYEQAIADYKAGRIPGKNGLYIHERLRA